MEKELYNLLNEVNVILQQEKIKKEESLKRGERFNMFATLGVAHYEVTHSAIIASFLDPKESHGQGDKFLRVLLDVIDSNRMPDTSNVSVFTEFSMNDGRIDILIEDNLGHGIIIENKIYASDQDKQLIRYNSFAYKKYGSGNYSIYYLTLYGNEASKESAKGIEYNCISYSKDIMKWLDNCIKESAATPLIRETLIQYRNHIKQLTNQDMETINKEELLETMAANPAAVAAIYNSQEDYKRFVYNRYVRPKFEKFCADNKLVFKEENLFGSGRYRGFCFHRESWLISAIYFYTDNADEWNFYWGISDYQSGPMNVEFNKMDCFYSQPSNGWPYGCEYLNEYRNWDAYTISEMIKGNFVEYIISLVKTALEEIDRKGLPMP